MVGNTASEASEVMTEDEAGPDDFLAEALRIAHQIRAAARSFQEGVSWNTVGYYPQAKHWQLEPMGSAILRRSQPPGSYALGWKKAPCLECPEVAQSAPTNAVLKSKARWSRANRWASGSD